MPAAAKVLTTAGYGPKKDLGIAGPKGVTPIEDPDAEARATEAQAMRDLNASRPV